LRKNNGYTGSTVLRLGYLMLTRSLAPFSRYRHLAPGIADISFDQDYSNWVDLGEGFDSNGEILTALRKVVRN